MGLTFDLHIELLQMEEAARVALDYPEFRDALNHIEWPELADIPTHRR